MGFGIGLGFLYQNPIILALIEISFIIDNFKSRVAAEAAVFEAEECLTTTLTNLNSYQVDPDAQIVRDYAIRVRADGGTVEGFESTITSIKKLTDQELYGRASLSLFPSGVKAGKAYSILPTNGNGDLTVVRNTTKTRTNGAGLIETVAANVPSLNYDTIGGAPSILLEPQRTNVAVFSNDFTNSQWVKFSFNGTSTVQANNVVSPEGILNAHTITPPQVTPPTEQNNRMLRQISAATNQDFTFTIFVKSSVAGVNFKLIHSAFQSDINVKEVSFVTTTEWARYEITSNTANSAGLRALISFGNTIQIYGAQIEFNSTSTSYIPTTSEAVTRNADLISKIDIYNTGLITNSGGTLFLHLINNVPLIRDSNARVLYLGDAAANAEGNGFSIINVSGSAARLTFFKVINGSNIVLYTSVNDNLKIAIKWNGTTADVFANGSKVVSQTSFTATQLNFLYNTFGGCQKSSFKAIGLFPSPLIDSECVTLTTT